MLPALIDTIVSEKRVQFRDKINIEIESDLKNSYGSFVNINSTELKRVVSNLINNSIEAFSDAKGKIDVLIQRDQKKVTLIVQDNGNGIPESVKEKIFQPFFTTKPTGQATGLGLSLSYDIIRAHGGEIRVDSKEERGTEFTIKIPIV